jgi:RNA polymerase sigma factor (sigma-70 family)
VEKLNGDLRRKMEMGMADFGLGGDILAEMDETDMQLLRRYLGEGAEDAFTEVVKRNLPLVYSAALRQVRSGHLAEEIAQSVFSDLARSGSGLQADTVVSAWLYRVTRRTAVDVIRRETRRLNREQSARELNAMASNTDDWTQLEPVIEEAMDALEETDRSAVLLRYFQKKSLREVAEALGSSENAAQKRVARAMERLREFFLKKGVSVSEGGLALAISTNSAEAVPLALATKVAEAALSVATTAKGGAAIAAMKSLGMTTTQKILVASAVCVGIGTALYQARPRSALAPQIVAGSNNAPETVQRKTDRERDKMAERAALLEAENERLKGNSSELLKLRDEVTRLRAQSRDGSKEHPPADAAATAADTNSLQYVIRVLANRDEATTDSMRYNAAEKLRSLGPEAVEALPAFLDLLHSETEATRYAGARALAFISERSADAFQQLTNALTDPNPQVRDAATHGAGLLFNQDFKNVDVLSMLPTVLHNLEDSSRTVRADSIQSLRQYIDRQHWSGKDAAPDLVVPALIARLSDSDSYARRNAAQALEAYGQKAQAAVPYLRPLLADPDEQVKRLAAKALSSIEPRKAGAE